LTEAHLFKQLVQGCTRQRGGQDSNLRPQVQRSNHSATEPHRTSCRPLNKSREWTRCVCLEVMKLGTRKLKFDTLTDVPSTYGNQISPEIICQ